MRNIEHRTGRPFWLAGLLPSRLCSAVALTRAMLSPVFDFAPLFDIAGARHVAPPVDSLHLLLIAESGDYDHSPSMRRITRSGRWLRACRFPANERTFEVEEIP